MESSLLCDVTISNAHGDSEQYNETDDDFESYSFTTAYDTEIIGHNLSPYLILSKTDYQEDYFGRILAYLIIDGEDVSQKLVETGLGVVYDRNNKKDWCSENGY